MANCCDIHTTVFADQTVRLRVPVNSSSYFVSCSGSSLRGTQSPTSWSLQPKNEDDPWGGLILFDGSSYIAENSQLTSDPSKALPLLPIPVDNWSAGTFYLKAAGSVTDKPQALTLDTSDYSVTLKGYVTPSSSPPLCQQWLLDGSGLTFSCTIEEETLQAGLDFFGWQLTDAEVTLLALRLPRLNYEALQLSATAATLGKSDATDTVVGVVLAGIVGGIGGFLLLGPPGALAGAGTFAALGANIGLGIVLTNKDVDQIVLSQAKKSADAMQSYFSITPSGGSYFNTKVWEDIGQLANFAVIGEAGIPLAGCVLPPSTGNKFRTWLTYTNKIVGYPTDVKLYPPLNNVYGGRKIYLQLFVIVQTVDVVTKYQLRIHPKWINTAADPNRKVHSQLSDGSRFWALIQGAGSDHMKVYGAGELYLIADDGKENAGTLLGISAQSGHYFKNSDNFNEEVYATMRSALKALGYTNEFLVGQDLTDALQGWGN